MARIEVIARRTPTTVRYGPEPDAEIRLERDRGAAFQNFVRSRPGRFELPGPGEGGPPDVTMRTPSDLYAASPTDVLAHAKDNKVHIRIEGVSNFDLRETRPLAEEAEARGVGLTFELG
jgi:hypothetical protein